MKKILKEIGVWIKQNKGEVCFVGSFCSFDKKGEVKDGRIIGFGPKKCVKISLEELKSVVAKEKGDFINL